MEWRERLEKLTKMAAACLEAAAEHRPGGEIVDHTELSVAVFNALAAAEQRESEKVEKTLLEQLMERGGPDLALATQLVKEIVDVLTADEPRPGAEGGEEPARKCLCPAEPDKSQEGLCRHYRRGERCGYV